MTVEIAVLYLQLCTEHDLRVRINKITILTLDLSNSDSDNHTNWKVNSSDVGKQECIFSKD